MCGRQRVRDPTLLALVLAAALTACGGDESGGDESGGDESAQTRTVGLEVTAPRDGTSVRAGRIAVRGTVTPADATVQVIGRAAQVGNGVFAASVPLDLGENTIDIVASAPNAAPATMSITVTRRRPAKAASKRRSPPAAPPAAPPLAGARPCAPGLVAGARTSCPFAENVRQAFEASGSGVLDVYSPTTGQSYRMYCTAGAPHVCTGGNGASVYFFGGSARAAYDVDDCGGGLSVGPNTTCAFAANVRTEYYRSGAGWISVYSPVTRRTYSMYCTPASPHVCTGGNNAAVYFP